MTDQALLRPAPTSAAPDGLDQLDSDTQTRCVEPPYPAIPDTTSKPPALDGEISADNHRSSDTQLMGVVGEPAHPTVEAATSNPDPSGWAELRVWAEMFNDAQQTRIGASNRTERGGADPEVFAVFVDELKATEQRCRLHLRRAYRRTAPPGVIAWRTGSLGIGESTLARLLGHLGHPRWAIPHHWEGTGSARKLIEDEPFERGVGQLWQLCGHGAPARRQKGISAEELAAQGSPTLKMLVHLLAEAAIKEPHRSTEALLAGEQFPDEAKWPYRRAYEQFRLDYVDKVHTVECVRCGPSGKPAQPGAPWSPGHQHGSALRRVGKEILRDLWKVSA